MIGPLLNGHLGARVSALLDGQLCEVEEERAWQHVHACHPCRDLVEREGWLKTQLATLSGASCRPGEHLTSNVLAATARHLSSSPSPSPSPCPAPDQHVSFLSRHRGMLVLGGSAAGLAGVSLAVLSVLPSGTVPDRRVPVTTSIRPTPAVLPGHRLVREAPRTDQPTGPLAPAPGERARMQE